MTRAEDSRALYGRLCAFFIERITARATFLRKGAERELAGPIADLRLVLALEEIVERLAASGLKEGEFECVHFATALSGDELGARAEMADHQLRQRGETPDVFLEGEYLPDEARVLQVLLSLQEIPRLAGKEAAEVIQSALRAPLASKGDSLT